MSDIGVQFKQAREAKGLSLDEVAKGTKINKKYLLALEAGTPVGLPDIYVQAFIKDYAKFLEIELPDSHAIHSPSTEVPREQNISSASPTPQQSYAGSSALRYPQILKPKRSHQFRILFLFTLVALLLFVGLIYWMRTEETSQSVEEVKFSDVVNEWEKNKPDTSESPFLTGAESDTLYRRDSLVLEGAAVESVWVRVVIDGSEIKEFVLPPLARIKCEGQQFFELSMDNARGISFSLNGKKIGTLSQMKKPLWNVMVSKSTMEKLQKTATGKSPG